MLLLASAAVVLAGTCRAAPPSSATSGVSQLQLAFVPPLAGGSRRLRWYTASAIGASACTRCDFASFATVNLNIGSWFAYKLGGEPTGTHLREGMYASTRALMFPGVCSRPPTFDRLGFNRGWRQMTCTRSSSPVHTDGGRLCCCECCDFTRCLVVRSIQFVELCPARRSARFLMLQAVLRL